MDNQQIDEALANESRAWVTITVSSIMLALATLSVALRSYTRIVMINHFGMDDYAAAISLVSHRIYPTYPTTTDLVYHRY
jgi:hypothetical protein